MAEYTRRFDVSRESVNVKDGTFEAVLFSDGEASDGHILNVRGGEIPARIPMFVNHFPDPTEQLGSLEPVRTTAHEVIVRGHILTEGEGAAADVRRDILLKLATGHVSAMSGRWDADEAHVQRRSDLPKSHPAHVGSDARGAQKYGLFFEKWRAMEGSIVGLGADPAATVRFAEDADAPEAVRQFWRGYVEDQAEPEPEEADPLEDALLRIADLSARIEALEAEGRRTAPEEPEQPTQPDGAPNPEPNPAGLASAAQIVADAFEASERRVEARMQEILRHHTGR